jgi:ABC-type branched-subunit amino acid transport system substrate-binding protein
MFLHRGLREPGQTWRSRRGPAAVEGLSAAAAAGPTQTKDAKVTPMREDVRRALAINPNAPSEQRTIDITTTGRRSGRPRRIEIVFYRFEDSVYLTRFRE